MVGTNLEKRLASWNANSKHNVLHIVEVSDKVVASAI